MIVEEKHLEERIKELSDLAEKANSPEEINTLKNVCRYFAHDVGSEMPVNRIRALRDIQFLLDEIIQPFDNQPADTKSYLQGMAAALYNAADGYASVVDPKLDRNFIRKHTPPPEIEKPMLAKAAQDRGIS